VKTSFLESGVPAPRTQARKATDEMRRSWADVKGTKKDSSLYSENPSSLREIAA
jgi:hypothetical protein